MSWDKDVAKAYSALRKQMPTYGVRVTIEDGIAVFRIPRAISGQELAKDSRLCRPKWVRGMGYKGDF